jgi:hypothetical protein
MVKLFVEIRMFPLATANHDTAARHGFSAQTGTFYSQFTEFTAGPGVGYLI